MKKVIAILFFLLAAMMVITGLAYSYAKNKKTIKISSFEECAAAGNRVMESYPRQCSLPNGNFFVETIIQGR